MKGNLMNTLKQEMIVTTKGKLATAVASLDEAVQVCANFRDTADFGSMIGASRYYAYGTGRVMVGGKKIAQIHYNGRVEIL